MRRINLFLLGVLLFLGCYSRSVHFIKHGRESYPPKPDDYQVLVIDNVDELDKEYTIIGLVVVESKADLVFSGMISDDKILDLLKKEARKSGADAIIDIQIYEGTDADPESDSILDIDVKKRSEAKAIVFK